MEMAVWKRSARRNSPSRIPPLQQAGHRLPPRLEVLANQALEAPTAGAHELLKQRCMPMPRADEIEVQTDVAQQYFARGPRPVEHLQGLAVKLFKVVFEHGQVELFLALEVVIEQRF